MYTYTKAQNQINQYQGTVGGGGFVQTTTHSTSQGSFVTNSGLSSNSLDRSFVRTSVITTGVIYDASSSNGNGAFVDCFVANRGSTGVAYVYINDKPVYLAEQASGFSTSGGLRLLPGESFRPETQVSHVAVLGSGFSIDLQGQFEINR